MKLYGIIRGQMAVEVLRRSPDNDRFFIPESWKLRPIQPPGNLPILEELTFVLDEPEIVTVANLAELSQQTTLESRHQLLGVETSEQLIDQGVSWLIRAREDQLIRTGKATVNIRRLRQSVPISLLKEKSLTFLLTARLLTVAKDNSEIMFMCRERLSTADNFPSALEIPGGTIEKVGEQSIERPMDAISREVTEEVAPFIPTNVKKRGVFLTLSQRSGKDRVLFNVTELATLDYVSHLRWYVSVPLSDEGESKWQVRSIGIALREGLPMLPDLYFVLNRLQGRYEHQYQIGESDSEFFFGEYIPYGKSYFETRGTKII